MTMTGRNPTMHPLSGAAYWVFLALPVHADDAAAARTVIDKAVQAMGGQARLAKLRAATWKAHGTIHRGDQATALTNENAAQLPDKFRFVMDLEASGNTVQMVLVMNQDRGWIQANGRTSDLPQDFHRSLMDCCYAFGLALMPQYLKEVDFQLSPLGELNINDRPAVGVCASRKGWSDVNVYFDKATSLPVKAETRIKEPDTQREVTAELAFSDYKAFDGIPSFTKMTWRWDGKLVLDRELSDVKRMEKLDPGDFARP
jgi:hypothetical protein